MRKYIYFFIAILLPIMLRAQKNSQWRGENRDGVYNETGLLKVWPEGGPQLLWKFEGLGAGFTSVAVANEKVYVTGMHDDNLILFVFDLNGNLITQKTVGKEWNKNFPGTRCSVLVNEGKLYIANSLGQLFCLDESTLNEIWKKDGLSDFDGRNIMFGMTENPLIVGNKIFLSPGGVKNGFVALNKNTGELIWSSPGVGTISSYCSPQFIGGYAVPMVVTCFTGAKRENSRIVDNNLIAFNAETGEIVWKQTVPSENDINPNTPIYSNGHIFFSTGYKGGSWLFRLKDNGKAVEQVWYNSADDQHHGPVKVGDYVFATSHNNERGFHCIDWKTGETKYRETHPQSSSIVADGMIYSYDDRGGMSLIKPNPEKFELVSKFQITLGTNQHWAHPVIHKGVLYIRHGDALMAYAVK